MCPLAPAPAAIYLPWPWQAPWNWLPCIVLTAVLCWAWFIRRPRRWFAMPIHWPIASGRKWLTRLAIVACFASLFIMILAVFPSMVRNDAWYHSQFARFSEQTCNLDMLFTLSARHQETTVAWSFGAIGLTFLGGLLNVIANPRIFAPFAYQFAAVAIPAGLMSRLAALQAMARRIRRIWRR